MLKILRNIRSNSLKNNKLAQYTLYALGEVILVIIGILIAVSLNNSNEERKERREIHKILAQIQSDLANNLYVIADHNIKYSAKDTLVNDFLNALSNNEVPSQEQAYGAWQALMRYNSFELQNDGYKSLILKAEYIPEEYSGIVNSLNYLYKQLYGLIIGDLTSANQKIEEFKVKSGESTSWYMDLTYNGIQNDEFLDFLLNDLDFRNMLATDFYSSGVLDSRTNKFYQYGLQTYRDINEVLTKYDLQLKRKPFFDYEISKFDQLLGQFVNEEAKDTFNIINTSDLLQLTRPTDTTKYELYPASRKNMTMTGTIGYFDIDYQNDSIVKGIRIHRGSIDGYYNKLPGVK